MANQSLDVEFIDEVKAVAGNIPEAYESLVKGTTALLELAQKNNTKKLEKSCSEQLETLKSVFKPTSEEASEGLNDVIKSYNDIEEGI
mgnify:CR=1 FL=1